MIAGVFLIGGLLWLRPARRNATAVAGEPDSASTSVAAGQSVALGPTTPSGPLPFAGDRSAGADALAAFARWRHASSDRREETADLVSALLAWEARDPAAAWQWMGTELELESTELVPLLSALAKSDAVLAWELAVLISDRAPTRRLELHLAAIDGPLAVGDIATARALAAQFSSGSEFERAHVKSLVAQRWAYSDGKRAADWALALPQAEEREQVLIAVGRAWATSEPSDAARFVAALPESSVRRALLRETLLCWVAADPMAANEWLVRLAPHSDFDHAIAAVATHSTMSRLSPDLALAWASTIQDPALRRQTIADLVPPTGP